MDMGMPVIASPKFLDKVKTNALNFEDYKPLKKNDGIFKLMEGSLSANWSFEWSKINVPTLVMTGHLDKMFRVPQDIEELVKKNYKLKKLSFTSNISEAIKKANIIFICVGTPKKKNSNAADLSQIFNVAKEISKNIKSFKIIINKSTVPVTTGDEVEKIIQDLLAEAR